MSISGISKLRKKRYRLFLLIVMWLLIGIFISAFIPPIAIFILNPLIGFCVTLFIISIFKDLRELDLTTSIIILIVSIVLAINFFFFRQIILFLHSIAIVSYILITAVFSLYGCYSVGKKVDKSLYNWPSPLNHIIRIIEFLGGILLGILIVHFTLILTGGRLFLIVWVFYITIAILALISIILLLTKKFNAWLGTFTIYAGIYFFYLTVSFLFARMIYAEPGAYPIIIRIVIAALDVSILLYTIGILVGERAEILGRKVKFVNADTILIWLIFAKAAYELAIILDPFLTSTKNQWVLLIFIALLGIVGFIGICKYKKYRKKRKK
ncbi:MAG: hypothetical protein EU532_01090 [Promethearchaeota archaeon]|nr:MAG: hypothetical protein EU532_01090 [Candidatus Lokiarchaeota archaeon]